LTDETETTVGLEALFRAHYRSLFRLAVLLLSDVALAEELTQETFFRFHCAARPARPGAELAYMRRTLVNLCHGHHRHLAVVRRAVVPLLVDAPSAEDETAGGERQRAIAAAVRSLPTRQRECVVLHYYAELSDSEVGHTLGISAGSVKRHLHRARATLAAQLEGER
jgi:RNA polymerase sigma factor (sigma-70 family)